MLWKIVTGLFQRNVDLTKESNRKYNNRRFNSSIKKGALLNHENGAQL